MPRATQRLWERFELDYFRRMPPYRAVKRWLSVGSASMAVAWIAWATARHDNSLYSSGPMTGAHAILADDCGKCHTVPWRGVHVLAAPAEADRVMNEACLRCHGNSIGHDPQTMAALHQGDGGESSEPPTACHHCHDEHEGLPDLVSMTSDRCTSCHEDLRGEGAQTDFHSSITAFGADHPEFRLLVSDHGDPGTIKLNHEWHLKTDLRSPDGPVQMSCADCHRAGRSAVPWPYGRRALHQDTGGSGSASEPHLQAAYMEPIRYSLHCVQCHELDVDPEDKRLDGGAMVPHDSPEAIRTYLRGALIAYIRTHPEELDRRADQPFDRRPALREMPPAEVNRLSLEEWTERELEVIEQEIYHDKKVCIKCHEQRVPEAGLPGLPEIVPPQVPRRWFAHASFDHDRHRVLRCEACHGGALSSAATKDVLLPGIETCRACHAPRSGRGPSATGGVADSCVTCHTYHKPPKDPQPGRTFQELTNATFPPNQSGSPRATLESLP